MPSIRRFLLLSLIAATLATTLLGATWTWFSANRQKAEITEQQMEGTLELLSSWLDEVLSQFSGRSCEDLREHIRSFPASLMPVLRKAPRFGRLIQIYCGNPPLLLTGFDTHINLSNAPVGFSVRTIDDAPWQVLSAIQSNSDTKIIVAYDTTADKHWLRLLFTSQVLPLLILLPFLALIIDLLINYALRPIERIAQQLKNTRINNMTPLNEASVPREITPMITTINDMLSRLETAIHNQSRFSGDAAHELKTPLAGARAQAQLAMIVHDDDKRQKALHNMMRGVDRANHLVEQLLTLSRLDLGEHKISMQDILLNDIVREVCEELNQAAEQQQQQLTAHISEQPIYCHGNPILLRALCRNIIDNALRYTPEHGHVTVCLKTHENKIHIAVIDSGPGIPPAQRQRVFARFYRQIGTKQEGSGLGLSIAEKITTLHNGQIELLDPPSQQGLQVRITLPLPKQSPPNKQT